MKALLFDLDGTLLDTAVDLASSMNVVLLRHNFPTKSDDEYRSFIGKGIKAFVLQSLPSDKRDEATLTECYAEMKKDYAGRWRNHTVPFPGITDLLDMLTKRNIPMTILTNKEESFAKEMIKQCLSLWHFSFVIGGSPNALPKPDPTGALSIAKHLNLLPSEILYLGDSTIDMQTAQKAGMKPFFATWGYQKENPENIPQVNHPSEVINYFLDTELRG